MDFRLRLELGLVKDRVRVGSELGWLGLGLSGRMYYRASQNYRSTRVCVSVCVCVKLSSDRTRQTGTAWAFGHFNDAASAPAFGA